MKRLQVSIYLLLLFTAFTDAHAQAPNDLEELFPHIAYGAAAAGFSATGFAIGTQHVIPYDDMSGLPRRWSDGSLIERYYDVSETTDERGNPRIRNNPVVTLNDHPRVLMLALQSEINEQARIYQNTPADLRLRLQRFVEVEFIESAASGDSTTRVTRIDLAHHTASIWEDINLGRTLTDNDLDRYGGQIQAARFIQRMYPSAQAEPTRSTTIALAGIRSGSEHDRRVVRIRRGLGALAAIPALFGAYGAYDPNGANRMLTGEVPGKMLRSIFGGAEGAVDPAVRAAVGN